MPTGLPSEPPAPPFAVVVAVGTVVELLKVLRLTMQLEFVVVEQFPEIPVSSFAAPSTNV